MVTRIKLNPLIALQQKSKAVRRLPDQFLVIEGIKLEEAINIVFSAYKEIIQRHGRNHSFMDLWGKHAKYRKYFREWLCGVLGILYLENPNIRLKQFQFIKLGIDYFEAIYLVYEKRNLPLFGLNQIATFYSISAWQEYCAERYGSLQNYLKTGLKLNEFFEVHKRLTAEDMELVQIAKPRNVKGIENLSQIRF